MQCLHFFYLFVKISSLVADCNNLFDIVLHIVAQPVDEKLVDMTKITQLLLFLSQIKNTFSWHIFRIWDAIQSNVASHYAATCRTWLLANVRIGNSCAGASNFKLLVDHHLQHGRMYSHIHIFYCLIFCVDHYQGNGELNHLSLSVNVG